MSLRKKGATAPFLFQTPSSPNGYSLGGECCKTAPYLKGVKRERVQMILDLTGLPKHAQRNRDEVDTEQAF